MSENKYYILSGLGFTICMSNNTLRLGVEREWSVGGDVEDGGCVKQIFAEGRFLTVSCVCGGWRELADFLNSLRRRGREWGSSKILNILVASVIVCELLKLALLKTHISYILGW